VRFEVIAPAKIEVADCNCSICDKSGYLHLIVPADRFKLISGRGHNNGDEVLLARPRCSTCAADVDRPTRVSRATGCLKEA
jgi:hypothetical protein